MSLDLPKLERMRRREDGSITARCPACAETGGDAHGDNHLLVEPGGRFGCCANPGDKAHRRRIFALVGVKDGRARQGRALPEPEIKPHPIGSQSGKSILHALKGDFRTLRTGISGSRAREMDSSVKSVQGPETPRPNRPKPPTPHRLKDGTLVIPFSSPPEYHWWTPTGRRMADITRRFPFPPADESRN
jgi:hypothetical protein